MIIYKYVIEPSAVIYNLMMPLRAKILSVQNQNEKIGIWAGVDETQVLNEVRKFRIVMTGFKIAPPYGVLTFLGTVQFDKGTFVLHVFEEN